MIQPVFLDIPAQGKYAISWPQARQGIKRVTQDIQSFFAFSMGTRYPSVAEPIRVDGSSLRDVALKHDVSKMGNGFFDSVGGLMRDSGHAPQDGIVIVFVNGTYGGGLGISSPFKGWYKQTTGGLAMVGVSSIVMANRYYDARRTRTGNQDERNYFSRLWTVIHELGHALGLPHAGWNAQYPDGRPNLAKFKRSRVMAYSRNAFIARAYTNLTGWNKKEARYLRALSHLDKDQIEDSVAVNVFLAKRMLAGKLSVEEGLRFMTIRQIQALSKI